MGSDLVPIKEVSGKLLLYFYLLQRADPSKLYDLLISFQMRHFEKDSTEKSPKLGQIDPEINKDLESMDISDSDLFNAILYLDGKYFISVNRSPSNVSDSFHNFRVEPGGIDVIEGIERGSEEKKQFNITFNIKVENNTNIESLLKANLGSIFTGVGLPL